MDNRMLFCRLAWIGLGAALAVSPSRLGAAPVFSDGFEGTAGGQETSDLSLSIVDDRDPLLSGEIVTYELTIANAGPAAATDIGVFSIVPAGAQWLGNEGDGWSCAVDASEIGCSRATLASGAQSMVFWRFRTPAGGGSLQLDAQLEGEPADPALANNVASQQTTVIGPGDCGFPSLISHFEAADGAAWPAPWSVAGGVDEQHVQAGQGYLRPTATGYSLARMRAPVDTDDVEVQFDLRLDDSASQGVGFYVRQNGGHLTTTVPAGQGYAVFVEGTFRGLPGVSLWREVAGQEIQIAHSDASVAEPLSGVMYTARFRARQADAGTTLLQARIWQTGAQEPAEWQVTALDATPALQNIQGGIAVDSWSNRISPPIVSGTWVDNVIVTALCDP